MSQGLNSAIFLQCSTSALEKTLSLYLQTQCPRSQDQHLHLKTSEQPVVPLHGSCAQCDILRQQLMSVLCGLCDRSENRDTAPAAKNTSVYIKHISEIGFERRSMSMAIKSIDHSKEVKKGSLLLLFLQQKSYNPERVTICFIYYSHMIQVPDH